MKRKFSLTVKVFSVFIGLLVIAAISVLSSGGLIAQTPTKQLKAPNPQKAKDVIQIPEDKEAGKISAQEEKSTSKEENDPAGLSGLPQGSQSYSVVIESKTGPDGKQIRTKKIWKDGKLVEETEENIEPGAAQNDDSIIELPDGFTAPGTILRSEHFGDFPFGAGNPFEQAEQFFQDQQKRMEAIRKQIGAGSVPGQIPQQIPQQVHVAAPSQYWIGVSVRLVPEMYAVHLGLPANTGVMISDVLPGYAAEKAGLKKYDIIVSVNGKTISDIQEIGKIFDANPDKKLKMEIIRAGKKTQIEITPEKRPVNPGALKVIGPLGANDGEDESIRIIRPGVIVPKAEAEELQKQQIQKDSQKKIPQDKNSQNKIPQDKKESK